MSYRLKIILGIAAIQAVMLAILIVSSLNYLRQSNEEELRKRAQTTAKLFSTAVRDAVLATDLATLDSTVAAVMTNPGMVYARITANGRTLAGPAGCRRHRTMASSTPRPKYGSATRITAGSRSASPPAP